MVERKMVSSSLLERILKLAAKSIQAVHILMSFDQNIRPIFEKLRKKKLKLNM